MSAPINTLVIAPLGAAPATLAALGEIMVETVAHGGSVNFMHPMPLDDALAFWRGSLEAAAAGDRIVLGAFDGDTLAGTVTLMFAAQPNQPHRAEIGKLMTRVSHRRRGIARALMLEAERLAGAHGRTLLVLDTAQDGGASDLYEGMGWELAGVIPDYAYTPHGSLTATRLYWKRTAAA